MLDIRRVLYPTDRSSAAETAFTHALHLAAAHGAELHAIHITEQPTGGALDLLPLTSEEVHNELHLAPSNRPDNIPADQVVQREIEGDDPADGILDYAEHAQVDLIVLGTHGRGGVQRMVLGSVAERVVREAPCPVMTVRKPAGKPIERLLVPVDFSDHSKGAITTAQALAAVYGASIELLYVIDAEDMPLTGAPLLGPVHVAPEEVEKRIRRLMDGLVKEYQGDVPVSGRVVEGDPARAVLEHAETHADLVVMATHGRTGVKRLLLGSVAEKIVRQAPCPVFTVKSFGARPVRRA